MSDDGGLMYWQQIGAHEVDEFMAMHDKTIDSLLNMGKADAYAMALPGDISAAPHEVVENQKLWRGWVGTVFGKPVGTDNGFKFESRQDAVDNAQLFVEQCKAIAAKKK